MSKKKFPWWMRIKVRVLVFGVLMSIVPLLVLGLASFNAAKSYLQGSIQEQNYERALVLAGEIRDFIENSADNLTHVTSTNAQDLVGEDSSAREVVLGTILREGPYFENLEVLDSQFHILGRVSRRDVVYPVKAGEKLANLEFTANQDFSISGVFFSPDGRPQVYLTVGIKDPQTRKNIGYMQAKTDLKVLVTRFTNIQIGQAGYVYITDEKGNLIGHSDFSQVLVQGNVKQNPSVQGFLMGKGPARQGIEYESLQGIRVIGMYAPVGNPGWGVFIEQPIQEAYQPIAQFTLKFIGIILIGILAVTLISIIFGLKLTQPIEHFEEGVQRIISTEDLNAEIPQESDDEIGRLVQAFNNLLSQLEDKTVNLRTEQELLQNVVNGIGAGMALVNGEKRLLWWNTIFEEWFGTKEKNLQNLACEEILRGDKADCVFEENGRVITLEVQGERRYIRQTYYELTSGSLESAAFLLLLEDVTQQVEMEARVIETEKMAAVGLLASGVAHEINNPLAIVSAHSEDLIDRLREDEDSPKKEEIQGVLRIVHEQVDRCKQITSRLLHFARRGKQGHDLIDVSGAIRQTLALLNYQAKQKKLTLMEDTQFGLWVRGNENEWQQVILNLLTNAVDASFEGGVVKVRAYRSGSEILVEVEDQGQGIPSQHLTKVFDPFFTTKAPGQGTGLGLFVSYGIVQKMQGQLLIESTEGKGTTVTILLPFQEVEEIE
jgi:two-component system, NtrC family, sensor kinase